MIRINDYVPMNKQDNGCKFFPKDAVFIQSSVLFSDTCKT